MGIMFCYTGTLRRLTHRDVEEISAARILLQTVHLSVSRLKTKHEPVAFIDNSKNDIEFNCINSV